MKKSKFADAQIVYAIKQFETGIEQENNSLKQLIADLSLYKQMLQDIVRKKL